MSDRITFAAKITPEGRRLKGSVVLAGSRTFRDGELVEVDPKALLKADATNVRATIDHDSTRTVGATRNGTLTVNRTEVGLDFATAELPNTSYANDALELAHGDYYGGASFTIEGIKSKFSVDPETKLRVRTINSIKRLVDVAIVMDPAFSNSSAAAFSKETPMGNDNEEQQAPPQAPVEPPKVEFSEQPVGDWAEFAKSLTTEQLTNGMDQIMQNANGKLQGEHVEQYKGFAAEFQRRARADAQAKLTAENLELQHNIIMGRTPKAPQPNDALASDDYAHAFSKYLRTGKSGDLESFAQSVAGSGAEGGYAVPDGFLNRVTERMVAYGGIAGVAETITTATGESLRWPSNDDTANSAAIAAEGVAGAAGADLVLGSITLGAFSYDANGASNVPVKVSLELLQDSAIDFEAFVGRKLGERLGRKMASDLANGAGTTEPFGLFSKSADTMTATVASLAAVEHVFQVDSAYRDEGNCRWVMSDTTVSKLWASQAAGLPIFIPGGSDIVGRPGGTLLGYPITIDAAAGTKVAFGDIRRGFIIRRVRGVQVMVDPYTLAGVRQMAYHAWARMDSNIQDGYAFSVSEWSTVSSDT